MEKVGELNRHVRVSDTLTLSKSELVEMVNERYGTEFTEFDSLSLQSGQKLSLEKQWAELSHADLRDTAFETPSLDLVTKKKSLAGCGKTRPVAHTDDGTPLADAIFPDQF